VNVRIGKIVQIMLIKKPNSYPVKIPKELVQGGMNIIEFTFG
jgi:hypothetical protein